MAGKRKRTSKVAKAAKLPPTRKRVGGFNRSKAATKPVKPKRSAKAAKPAKKPAARKTKTAAPQTASKPPETTVLDYSSHRIVPIRLSKALHFIIDGTSLNQPVVICVDTGAATSVIASQSSSKFQVAGISDQKQIAGIGAAELVAESAVCQNLSLGDFEVTGMDVMIASLAHVHDYLTKMDEEPYDMIIGSDFLIGHKALIDCTGRRLLLHPVFEETKEIKKMRALVATGVDDDAKSS